MILSWAAKMTLFRSQPLIEELDSRYCTFTVNEAIGILGEFGQPTQLRFKLQQTNDYELLRDDLDKKWAVVRGKMKTFDGGFHYAKLEKLRA